MMVDGGNGNSIGFSVVTPTNRLSCVKKIIENYDRQVFAPKELIIIINNDSMTRQDFEPYCRGRRDIRIYTVPQTVSLGECLNIGYRKAYYYYIAKMDDDDYYSKYYLQEAYELFVKEQCDIVCKFCIFYYLKEFNELLVFPWLLDYTRRVRSASGATICMTQKTFQQIQYSNLKRAVDVDLFSRCREIPGLRLYSTTSYNFLCIREQDKNQHTWKIDGSALRTRGDKTFGTHKMTLEEACKRIERYPVRGGN